MSTYKRIYKFIKQQKNLVQKWAKVGNYFEEGQFQGKVVLSEKTLESFEKWFKFE